MGYIYIMYGYTDVITTGNDTESIQMSLSKNKKRRKGVKIHYLKP